MSSAYNQIKKSFKLGWYIQSGSAVPIFIILSAKSGFKMKKILGYGYKSFLFNHKESYGGMNYLKSDLERIWKIIKNRTGKNPNYLKQIKKKYNDIFYHHEKTFKKIDSLNLQNIDEKSLIELFKQCAEIQTDSVGLAHILEPIGLEIEKEFKQKLSGSILDKKKFNRYYVLLTTPSKPSFIAREELKLKRIAELPPILKEKQLKQHLRDYFWIQNNYAGSYNITINILRRRLSVLKRKNKQQNFSRYKKSLIIKKLKLNSEIKKIVEIIDFATIWQDERKKNVLKTIGYFGRVLQEISKRTKINIRALYYLSISDVPRINSLNGFKVLKKDLISRLNGSLFLIQANKEYQVKGKLYKNLIKILNKSRDTIQQENEIHGSIANGGTAIGKVVICKDISSLKKVKQGDILVASMTRPEFIPAIKKASAIITDEGGVTSHAAIVAREFNIPTIIGTKIATRILKDGMIVEVRANHGVVKILRRS